MTQPGEGDRKVSSRVPRISVEAWLAGPGYPCAPRPWEFVFFWCRVTQSFSEWGLPSRLGPNLKAPFSLMCSFIPGYRDITIGFVKKGDESLHVEAWDV